MQGGLIVEPANQASGMRRGCGMSPWQEVLP